MKFILRNRQIQLRAVDTINGLDLGQPWEIIIRPFKPRKTDPQRNTLHLWLRIMAHETGHSIDELKHYIKAEYLGYEETLVMGRPYQVLRSTEELNRAEYADLLDRVAALAADLGIQLPAPEVDHGSATD